MTRGTFRLLLLSAGVWLSSFPAAAGLTPLTAEVPRENSDTAEGSESKETPAEDLQDHPHTPIQINAKPSMNRLKTQVVRPRRGLFGPDGHLYIADWAAGELLRINPAGDSETLVAGLNEPAGLAFDSDGSLYVCNHAQGLDRQGTVVRIGSMGERAEVVSNLTSPTALAFDRHGRLYVACALTNCIMLVTEDGMLTTFVDNIPSPSALLFDPHGWLWVASAADGSVYRVNTQSQVQLMATGLEAPSDLAYDRSGHLIVANFAGTTLNHVSPQGDVKVFAVVPKGTISHQFDLDDNIWLINWDYRFVMKITRNMSIDCPHCHGKIPLLFRPLPDPAPKPDLSL